MSGSSVPNMLRSCSPRSPSEAMPEAQVNVPNLVRVLKTTESAETRASGVANTTLPLAVRSPVQVFSSMLSAKNFWPSFGVPFSPSISTSRIRRMRHASSRSRVNCLVFQPGTN